LERLELAGDEPVVQTGKRKPEFTIDQVESMIKQSQTASKVREEEQGKSREDKIKAAKEKYLERKRQKLEE